MSILKTIPIALDLKRVGAQAQALPTLVEGDNGNVFVITMTDDGEPLDLSSASRVLCVFSKTSDGKTVEQDTEDANVNLDDYGITVDGDPVSADTITITVSGETVTAAWSGTGVTGAAVDAETFLERFQDDGSYVFTYGTLSWQYGEHSVMIGGEDNNVVTVALKAGSYGAGTNNCEIQIYSGDNSDVLVTSANFNFRGRKGIMNDETIQSEEKYPILVSLINEVSRAKSKSVLSVNGKTGDVELTYEDVDAEESGAASSAVSAHDESASAHAALFGGKQDTIIDLDTIRSGASDGAAALGMATDKVLYFTGIACQAMTGDFATISNSKITADHIVAECVFADPSNIETDTVTWTTANGSLVLNGECSTATTANILLIKKDN